MNPKNLNLYIVDDDEPTRASYVSLLLAYLTDFSIKTFGSGEAFLEGAVLDGSGVVLLDLRMEPGMSGLEVFAALKERASPLVVVFISGHGDIPLAVRAMEQGAVSWLEKPCANDTLIEALERAKERAVHIATGRRERHLAQERWNRLTPRWKQIAPMVAEGQSSKLIAQRLTQQDPANPIEHRTVENHRAKIFETLELSNSNELQAFMREHGL